MHTAYRPLVRSLGISLRLLLLFTVLLGLLYPSAVWAAGRFTADSADGALVRDGTGTVVGSARLGQQTDDPRLFHGRPSASGYDGLGSGASNLGPNSPKLAELIRQRRQEAAHRESVDPAQVPADALTASASGLDPHISEEYALLQVPRVARENRLDIDTVTQLVRDHTEQPLLGVIGEPRVNVLKLNLAVRQAMTRRDG